MNSNQNHISAELRSKTLGGLYSRRRVLKHALLTLATAPAFVTLLAACAEEDDDDVGLDDTTADDTDADPGAVDDDEIDDDDEDDTETETEEGQEGGVAIIAIQASPVGWDLIGANWETWRAVHYLYDRLLDVDDVGEVLPNLATDWEISDDGLEYTLELRDDVLFHDGTEFNADSVRWNIERHHDDPQSTTFDPVVDIELIDDVTVHLQLDDVDVNFIYTLTGWGTTQLSPTAAEGVDDASELRVGTGPFMFEDYEPDSHINYARNDDYWRGAPLLDGVQVRIIPEQSVQIIELETGGVHGITGVPPRDVGTLEDIGAIVEQSTVPGSEFISLNVSRGPTAEFEVRRAIAHAVDRDAMIDQVLEGFAEKLRAGISTNSPFYDDNVEMVEYDPDRAEELLEEAGWELADDGMRYRDGEPLVLNILSSDREPFSQFNEIIQDQLRGVGIEGEISSFEWGAYLDAWRENLEDWHLTYHAQGALVFGTGVMDASWAPEDFWNINRILDSEDPEMLELAEQLQDLSDEIARTLDMDERIELGRQVQELYQEHQLTVWLFQTESIAGASPSLVDYEMDYNGRVFQLYEAWLDE